MDSLLKNTRIGADDNLTSDLDYLFLDSKIAKQYFIEDFDKLPTKQFISQASNFSDANNISQADHNTQVNYNNPNHSAQVNQNTQVNHSAHVNHNNHIKPSAQAMPETTLNLPINSLVQEKCLRAQSLFNEALSEFELEKSKIGSLIKSKLKNLNNLLDEEKEKVEKLARELKAIKPNLENELKSKQKLQEEIVDLNKQIEKYKNKLFEIKISGGQDQALSAKINSELSEKIKTLETELILKEVKLREQLSLKESRFQEEMNSRENRLKNEIEFKEIRLKEEIAQKEIRYQAELALKDSRLQEEIASRVKTENLNLELRANFGGLRAKNNIITSLQEQCETLTREKRQIQQDLEDKIFSNKACEKTIFTLENTIANQLAQEKELKLEVLSLKNEVLNKEKRLSEEISSKKDFQGLFTKEIESLRDLSGKEKNRADHLTETVFHKEFELNKIKSTEEALRKEISQLQKSLAEVQQAFAIFREKTAASDYNLNDLSNKM